MEMRRQLRFVVEHQTTVGECFADLRVGLDFYPGFGRNVNQYSEELVAQRVVARRRRRALSFEKEFPVRVPLLFAVQHDGSLETIHDTNPAEHLESGASYADRRPDLAELARPFVDPDGPA